VITYADSLPDKEPYTTLVMSLEKLSAVLAVRPKCTSMEENKRILSMLESFFFIYSRWEKAWGKLDKESFKAFSDSISEEVDLLIKVWECEN
jgi:hypothetical protein